MINMSTVNAALKVLLDAGLTTDKYEVTRAGYINRDPDRSPWVSIYRGPSSYIPRTLGKAVPGKWKGAPVIRLLIQSVSGLNAVQAEERLEEYIVEVMDVILAEPTIGDTVKTIVGWDQEYSYNEEESETTFFQMVTIDITVEVRT